MAVYTISLEIHLMFIIMECFICGFICLPLLYYHVLSFVLALFCFRIEEFGKTKGSWSRHD